MYFVAGATGKTGSVVARALLSRGEKVRILVRQEERGAPLRAEGAEVVVGSLSDGEALARALSGAVGAYLLTPPNMASNAFVEETDALTRTFAGAIDSSGVPHVVLLSSMGAHVEAGTGLILAARAAEANLRASRASLSVLRAPYFMENWAGSFHALGAGELPSFFEIDRAMAQVATRDIGATAAALLAEGPHDKLALVELEGPRQYSPRDVAAVLSALLGKTISAERVPTSAMVPALSSAGLAPGIATLFREMTEAVNGGRIVWEGGAARAMRGSTTLESVLAGLLPHP